MENDTTRCRSCGQSAVHAGGGTLTSWLFRGPECQCERRTIEAAAEETANAVSASALVGRYEIECLLGSGAWGAVYLARDLQLKRKVAVKIMHKHLIREADLLQRFQREAEISSGLIHPNICTLFDNGTTKDGQPYMVMEYLAGLSLSTIVERDRRVPVKRVVHITTQICDALDYAHKRGVVHRDLKPANILLLEDDVPKLLDFGLARWSGSASLTFQGHTVGTPDFMSPEQWSAAELDGRSDMYSLGATMFFLLTGKSMVPSNHLLKAAQFHMTGKPPRLGDMCPDLYFSETLEEIVSRCLAKRKEDRFRDCLELREALSSVMPNREGESGRLEAAAGNERVSRRRLSPLALGSELAVVAVAGAAFWQFSSSERKPEPALQVKPIPVAVAPPPVVPTPKPVPKEPASTVVPHEQKPLQDSMPVIPKKKIVTAQPIAKPKPQPKPKPEKQALEPEATVPPNVESTARPPTTPNEYDSSRDGAIIALSNRNPSDTGRHIIVNRVESDDEAIQHLNRPVRCDFLSCNSPHVGNPTVEFALKRFPLMSQLSVSRSKIDDSIMKQLSNSSIVFLNIGATAVSDKGLAALTEDKTLRELVLCHLAITDRGVAYLAGTAIQKLNLRETMITPACVVSLNKLPDLNSLGVASTSFDDDALAHLKNLSQIRALDLNETPISDASIDLLNQMPALEELSLAWSRVTPHGLSRLRCPHLRTLDFSGLGPNAAALKAIADLPAIKVVRWGTVQNAARVQVLTDKGIQVTQARGDVFSSRGW